MYDFSLMSQTSGLLGTAKSNLSIDFFSINN